MAINKCFTVTEKFGMYSEKDKMTPQSIVVFDPLAGKHIPVNVDLLANE